MKLLHLDASALGSHSVSRGLTAAIVAEFTRNAPATEGDFVVVPPILGGEAG